MKILSSSVQGSSKEGVKGNSALIFFKSGPEVIKHFPCSTQLSTKFILLTNVKIPKLLAF